MSSALRGRVNQKRHGLFPCYGRSHINLLIINILNDLVICLCVLRCLCCCIESKRYCIHESRHCLDHDNFAGRIQILAIFIDVYGSI